MQIKPTGPQTLTPYKIDFAYGLDVKASFLCFGVYAMFHHVTQFQHGALSKRFFYIFSLSYIYKYI